MLKTIRQNFDNSWQLWLLIAVCVVGFALRLSGLFWGTPPFAEANYHPDEPKIVLTATEYPASVLNMDDLRYPTATHSLVGLVSWPARTAIKWLNDYQGAPQDRFIGGVTALHGRLLQIGLGTLTILVVYALAWSLYQSRQVAFLSAALLAFSLLHVANSAWITTDVTTGFLATVFLWSLLQGLKRPSFGYLVVSSLSLGLAVGAKYTAALFVLPVFIACYHYNQQNVFRAFKQVIGVGALALLAFFVSTPSILLHPDVFVASIQFESERMDRLSYFSHDFIAILANQFSCLMVASSPFVAVVFVVALLRALVRRSSLFEFSLALVCLVFFLYFGSALVARYLILILPIICMLSAYLVVQVCHHFNFRPAVNNAIMVLVVVQGVIYSGWGAVSRYPDTRSSAANYIHQNIPQGSTIYIPVLSQQVKHMWRYPSIDPSRYSVVFTPDKAADYMLVSSFDTDIVLPAFASGVIKPDLTVAVEDNNYWYLGAPPPPQVLEIYKDIYLTHGSSYQLVKRFAPWRWMAPIEFPPPVIELYKSIPPAPNQDKGYNGL